LSDAQYHTLRARGIPDERIITMMYDDVAAALQNPFQGSLYNRPTDGSDAIDVYKGCKKDYTGSDVTPETFMAVLTGDARRAGGPVLNSTEEDDVFINFADHGAPGLVAFPRGTLHARRLLRAFEVMHSKKMYRNLVFYLEACESGSMFANLPEDRNIYAVTAANGRESSYATYCPPMDDRVNGKHINTCLGDEFSVHWLEDTDSEASGGKETLLEQFKRVRDNTRKSHVMDFGDVNQISSEDISDFLGIAGDDSEPMRRAIRAHPYQVHESALVDSRDVPLVSKMYRYMREPSKESQAELHAEIQHRKDTDELFEKIARALLENEDEVSEVLTSPPPAAPTEWDCHEAAHEAFMDYCTKDHTWSDYSLKYSATLLALCEKLADKIPGGGHEDMVLRSIATACDPMLAVA